MGDPTASSTTRSYPLRGVRRVFLFAALGFCSLVLLGTVLQSRRLLCALGLFLTVMLMPVFLFAARLGSWVDGIARFAPALHTLLGALASLCSRFASLTRAMSLVLLLWVVDAIIALAIGGPQKIIEDLRGKIAVTVVIAVLAVAEVVRGSSNKEGVAPLKVFAIPGAFLFFKSGFVLTLGMDGNAR